MYPPSVVAVHKRYGEGSIQRLDSKSAVRTPVIPTGCLSLDLALGVGGLPRGRIAEIYGPERSGKTTFCKNLIAQAQMLGEQCAFIDVEHSFDPQWALVNGVDIDNLYISQPDYGEQALEIVEILLDDFGCIVVDSVAALVPKAELEGDMGDAHMGLQARLMGQAMRKLNGKVKSSNAVVVFTNQMRMKIGTIFGNPETTSGGLALRYFASIRIDIRKRDDIKDGTAIVGNVADLTIKKNKVAAPYRKASFDILYSSGLDRLSDIMSFADVCGIRKGGYYRIGEENIQGKDKALEALRNDPQLFRQLECQIRQYYGLPLWSEVLE